MLPKLQLKKVFYDLSATQFVIRLPPLDLKGKITPSFSLEYSPFEMPDRMLDGEENASKGRVSFSMKFDNKSSLNEN